MKKIITILVLGALTACLVPALAQNQPEWKSTSAMPTTGSTYAPQVTSVGAPMITTSTTTTESYSPAKVGGPRRSFDGGSYEGGGTNPGETGFQDPGSPIGDALLPLLMMAVAFAGWSYLRRSKQRLNAEC